MRWLWWLLAQESIDSVFLERGILGAIVLVLGGFAWTTIKQLRTDNKESQARERETQKIIYDMVIPAINRLASVVEQRVTVDRAIVDALEDNRRILDDARRVLEKR